MSSAPLDPTLVSHVLAEHDADDDRYRLTMEVASVGIAHIGPDGRYLEVNPAMCSLFGYTREEFLTMSVHDTSHPDDRNITKPARDRLHAGEVASFRQEKRCRHKDGRLVWVALNVAVRRDAAGQVMYDVSVVEDISARKHAEEALRESESRFKSLAALSSDWYWESDAEARITRVEGDGAEAIWQVVAGRTTDEIGLNGVDGNESLTQLQLKGRTFRDLVFTYDNHGRAMYMSASGEPLLDTDGSLLGYRGAARDITSRIRAQERIQYLAAHDPLTGLPNRATFSELLGHALATARRYDRSIAIAFIDLDRFKLINDSLGHTAGDVLLTEIAARLRTAVRESDVVARLGGDEFVVMLQECGTDADLGFVAEKILQAALAPVKLGQHECRVSASIGLARYPLDGDDAATLMKNADLAMYAAKETGKNTYSFYAEHITARSEQRLHLETHLRRALDNGEMSLHYQAKLELATDRISGVEALLRWTNPTLGNVSPADFIPIAEETGLILSIGRWVLRTACEQSMAWQQAGLPPVCMAVNLSPRQFSAPNLVDEVATILAETGLPAHLLELEITEGAVMPDPDRAVSLLLAIKALGVRVAMDDFGTGYSSLAQLKRFPLDTLKVDRSFIRELPRNAEDQAITEAIIAMGKTLSLTVVAEGVETADQQAFLGSRCCDEIQGYHFSRPLTAAGFADFLLGHVSEAS